MRKLFFAALASVAPLANTFAAEDAASGNALSANFSLVTDYRFRGLSQTGLRPAVQGGVDYVHGSGLYLGTWWSSVSGDQYPGGSGLETDWYGGYRFEAAPGLGVDLGAIHVRYPGVRITGTTTFAVSVPGTTAKADTSEIYLGLNWRWLSLKYNRTVGSSLFGIDYPTAGRACAIGSATDCYDSGRDTKGSGYLDLAGTFEIGDKLNLNLHWGRQTVANYGNYSYSDYRIGISKEIDGFSLGAAIVGTDAKDDWWYAQTSNQVGTTGRTKIGETGVVLSVGRTF